MTGTTCLCGFTELADETLTDHLHEVFEPADRVGRDGQVHEERELRVCACGLAAGTSGELDAHLLDVFTPLDGLGTDGQRHGAIDAA